MTTFSTNFVQDYTYINDNEILERQSKYTIIQIRMKGIKETFRLTLL